MIALALLLVPAVIVGAAAADAPVPTPADFEAQLVHLRSSAAPERLAAAQALTTAASLATELAVARLARPRPVAAETFRKLILEMWGQVPNPNWAKDGQLWTKKPEPPWPPPGVTKKQLKGASRPRRPPPHDPEKLDWIAALGDLDLDGNEVLKELPDRVEARALALEAVALMHGIAATRRPELLDPIFNFAFELDGVFRDECGRTIRSMESYAIPGLVHRMRAPAKGTAMYRQRRYASYQLDRMDRASPSKAITTAPDDRIRARIIHAYGEARALDAVDAILEQVDAPSRRVREEARWAWLRYVTGPPPPEAPKRKRKLPGGKEEGEEKEDYLNYREMALLALTRKLAVLHGELDCGGACASSATARITVPPRADGKQMTDEVFAFYDARRGDEWGEAYAQAQARAKAGDLAAAVDGYSRILAHDPFDARRAEMADTFAAYGEASLRSNPTRAATLLREAHLLDPKSPRARRGEAQLQLMQAMERLRAGQDDVAGFARALELDPSLDEAKRAIVGIEEREKKRASIQSVMFGAVGAGLLFALLLVGLGARRPERPRQT